MLPARRQLYRLAARVRKLYWFVFRPRTFGVKCLVEHNGRWLMIRNTYGRGHWTFPGGRIDRGETPEQAAIREVAEEVGIALESVAPFGVYLHNREYKRDTVYCFRASVMDDGHVIDPFEVAEAAWVPAGEPPGFRGPSVDEILRLLETSQPS
jgi:8-oxo-dGTP pyrophosphatase MutT (NUDIX family)